MRNLLIGLGVGYTVRAVRSSLVYKAAIKGDKKAEDELATKLSDGIYKIAFGEMPANHPSRTHGVVPRTSRFSNR